MAEKNSSSLLEKENYVKKLKRSFDSWREMVLLVNSILIWTKPTDPWFLVALPSVIFLKLFYWDPSFLTAVSLLGILITVLDFIGPMLSNAIWKQDNWTAIKERELEDICKVIAGAIVSTQCFWVYMRDLRISRPNMFYPSAIACLSVFAWIGNAVHNLLIMYLTVLLLLLLPGLLQYGIIQKFYHVVMLQCCKVLRSFSSAPTKKYQ